MLLAGGGGSRAAQPPCKHRGQQQSATLLPNRSPTGVRGRRDGASSSPGAAAPTRGPQPHAPAASRGGLTPFCSSRSTGMGAGREPTLGLLLLGVQSRVNPKHPQNAFNTPKPTSSEHKSGQHAAALARCLLPRPGRGCSRCKRVANQQTKDEAGSRAAHRGRAPRRHRPGGGEKISLGV